MDKEKSYKYWNGLITGIGLSQLWILWTIIKLMPTMTSMMEQLGATIPKLSQLVTTPIFYIGVPIIIIMAIIASNLIFKTKEKIMMIINSILVIIGWIILALIWSGIYAPFFDIMNKIG